MPLDPARWRWSTSRECLVSPFSCILSHSSIPSGKRKGSESPPSRDNRSFTLPLPDLKASTDVISSTGGGGDERMNSAVTFASLSVVNFHVVQFFVHTWKTASQSGSPTGWLAGLFSCLNTIHTAIVVYLAMKISSTTTESQATRSNSIWASKAMRETKSFLH